MSRKTLIWIGMAVGSLLGSFIPTLWGADALSISSVLFSTLGAIVGIWLGFRLGD